ncbi:MAG: dihydroorotate dehydrogenase electron transfer subunit [Candidatus Sericytochromatia bacterium]|nr:dihydroorotate dehydrogenase electron transfer subunit [Candidatus Sericytochromatia bacterium]
MRCRVLRQERVGDGIYALWIEAPTMTTAMAGQFVHVLCGDSYLRRPFSVFAIDGDAIGILYRVTGAGTRWLTSVSTGDSLDVLGPLGHGFTPPFAGERVVVVGGGVGVAPLALFASQHPEATAEAVLGFRNDAAVAGIEPFMRHAVPLTLLTEVGIAGLPGRVTDGLTERIATSRATRILTCGPDPMMRAVAHIAETLGLACQLSVERPMGCGVGLCLGCVLPILDAAGAFRYDRSCVEGPVFGAREVSWL